MFLPLDKVSLNTMVIVLSEMDVFSIVSFVPPIVAVKSILVVDSPISVEEKLRVTELDFPDATMTGEART